MQHAHTKHHILYVTPLWAGLGDILFAGRDSRGMPSFLRPLERLIALGHHVELFVGVEEMRELKISVPWLTPAQVHLIPWDLSSLPKKLASVLRGYRAVNQAVRRGRCDFIYAQGALGAIGNLVALRHGIPCGGRLYGTFLAKEVGDPATSTAAVLKSFLRHPLEHLLFRLPKAYLIMTDDASWGDKVFQRIGSPRFPFFFWRNGVDFPALAPPAEAPVTAPVLLYPARIDRYKRQDRAIRLVHLLREQYGVRATLLLAGHVTQPDYQAELEQLVAELHLEEQVTFAEPFTREALTRHYQQDFAVLSLYDSGNGSNITIESLANGAVFICQRDPSLGDVILDGVCGYLVDEVEDAARILLRHLEDPALHQRIKTAARQQAERRYLTWEERITREMRLIDAVATRHPIPDDILATATPKGKG